MSIPAAVLAPPHLSGVDRVTDVPKPPEALDAIADVVLRYRPKPVSDAAKQRKKRAKKAAKEMRDG